MVSSRADPQFLQIVIIEIVSRRHRDTQIEVRLKLKCRLQIADYGWNTITSAASSVLPARVNPPVQAQASIPLAPVLPGRTAR